MMEAPTCRVGPIRHINTRIVPRRITNRKRVFAEEFVGFATIYFPTPREL